MSVKVFILAHTEEQYDVEQFNKHTHLLQQNGTFTLVDYEECNVVLVFVSPKMLRNHHMTQKLHMAAYDSKRVITIFVKPCVWAGNKYIHRNQLVGLPNREWIYESLSRNNNQDKAWAEVSIDLRKQLHK